MSKTTHLITLLFNKAGTKSLLYFTLLLLPLMAMAENHLVLPKGVTDETIWSGADNTGTAEKGFLAPTCPDDPSFTLSLVVNYSVNVPACQSDSGEYRVAVSPSNQALLNSFQYKWFRDVNNNGSYEAGTDVFITASEVSDHLLDYNIKTPAVRNNERIGVIISVVGCANTKILVHTSAALKVNCSAQFTGCVCLSNATNKTNGQFQNKLRVTGVANQTWTVVSSSNAYTFSSPNPPVAPTSIAPGTVLIGSAPATVDTLDVKQVTGKPISITVTNGQGTTLTTSPATCYYPRPYVNMVTEYCVNHPNFEVIVREPTNNGTAGPIYINGILQTAPVIYSPSSKTPGTTDVIAYSWAFPDGCTQYDTLRVSLFDVPSPSWGCRGQVNTTLNEDGYAVADARLFIVGDVRCKLSYPITVMGHPSDTFTCADAGKSFMVMVQDPATGISCMSTISIFDKSCPRLISSVDTIDCNRDPLTIPYSELISVSDNCDANPIITGNRVWQPWNCNFLNPYTVLTVNWQFKDKNGNTCSATTQHVWKRPAITAFTTPADITIDCSANRQDTSITGYPMFNGRAVGEYCQYTVCWKDKDSLNLGCPGKYRITREFQIIDECSWQDRRINQYIYVVDNMGPVITNCPSAQVVISNTSLLCSGQYTIPSLNATDNCSAVTSKTAVINGNTYNAGTTVTLPVGVYAVQYVVRDACGNSSTCNYSLKIADTEAPTAICKKVIVVLNSSGLGSVVPASVDNGSNDNCCLHPTAPFKIKLDGESDASYRDVINFNCSNIGNKIIWLRVYDCNGNYNQCMDSLIVKDMKPVITCSYTGSGTVECTTFMGSNPLTYVTYSLTASCGATVTNKIINNLNSCGIGTVTVRYIATTVYGEKDSCERTLNIVNSHVFGYADIHFPANKTLTGCNPDTSAAANGIPTFDNTQCTNIRYYHTNSSMVNPQGCTVITRTWYVYNDCTPGSPPFTGVQLITVPQSGPPVILSRPNDTVLYTPTYACSLFVNLIPVVAQSCGHTITITNNYNGNGANASDYYNAGIHNVVFTVSNGCSTTTLTVVVTVRDTTKPQFTNCPSDIDSLECMGTMPDLSTFGMPTITDNCGSVFTGTLDVDTIVIYKLNSCGKGTVTRKWIATDPSGNRDSCVQVLTFESGVFTQNNITWPSDTTYNIACNSSISPDVLGRPIINQNSCTGVMVGFTDSSVPANGCVTITRAWAVMDTCSTPSVTYRDTQIIVKPLSGLPYLTVPSNVTLYAGDTLCGAIVNLPAAAGAACDAYVTITNNYNNQGAAINDTFPVGVTTIIFTAQNQCGITTRTVTVTVLDTIDPYIVDGSCPSNQTIDTCYTSGMDLSGYGEPVFGDNCGGIGGISLDTAYSERVSVNTCGQGTVTRVWIATDPSGNQDSCKQVLTFGGGLLTLGNIVFPPNVSYDSCNASIDPSVTGNPVITGKACYAVSITHTDNSEILNGCLTITRTWIVTDTCATPDQVFTGTQTITKPNSGAPYLSVPSNVNVYASDTLCGAIVNLPAAAGAACDAYVTITNNYNNQGAAINDTFPVGVTTIIFTAQNQCGITTRTVTVTVLDTIDPYIVDGSCPSNQTIDACYTSGMDLSGYGEPVFGDNCGGIGGISLDTAYSERVSVNTCGQGTVTRVWIATDPSGNQDSCKQVLTFGGGLLTLGNIDFPDDVEYDSCNASIDPSVTGNPVIVGKACYAVVITHTDNNEVVAGCLTITRSWTVTDTCATPDQVFTGTQTITKPNSGAPYLSVPSNVNVYASDTLCGAIVNLPAAAGAACDAYVTITNNYNNQGAAINDTFPVGIHIITFTAQNQCGITTGTVTVTVLDTIDPYIVDGSCPSDQAVGACYTVGTDLSGYGEPVFGDNCGGIGGISLDTAYSERVSVNTCGQGTVTRVWIATDPSGNQDSCKQVLTFGGGLLTLGNIDFPDDVEYDSCNASIDPSVTGNPVIIGKACYAVVITHTDNNEVVAGCLTITRSWTVTDTCATPDQVFTGTQTITKPNSGAPYLSVPSNVNVYASDTTCEVIINLPAAAGAACDAHVTITNNYNNQGAAINDTFPVGIHIITFTAQNQCGITTGTVTVTVLDTIKPHVIGGGCPLDQDVADCYSSGTDLSGYGIPVFGDNCGGIGNVNIDTTYEERVAVNGCGQGTVTRVWIATDPSGNQDSCKQVLTFGGGILTIDDIDFPDNVTYDSCDASIDPSITGSPVILPGGCSSPVITHTDNNIVVEGCLTITRTWTVTDTCTTPDQVFTGTQTITKPNSGAPYLVVPSNVTVYSSDTTCEVIVNLPAAAGAACDAHVTITNSYNNQGADINDTFPVGVTVITFTAVNNCGVTTGTVTVTVLDTIDPYIVDGSCPSDQAVDACYTVGTDLSGYGVPVFGDNCGGIGGISLDTAYSERVSVNTCGQGTVTRVWIATDPSGNQDSCKQVLTFGGGLLTLGNIDFPDDIEYDSCNASIDPSVTGNPVIVGKACYAVVITHTDNSEVEDGCLTITRSWTVTDTCATPDQVFTGTQTITKPNSGAPYLSVPSDVTVYTTGVECDAIIDLAVAVGAECDAHVTITNNYNNQGGDINDTFPVGVTEVIFTAVNQCGTTTDTVTITVLDTLRPVLSCPADVTVTCDSGFDFEDFSGFSYTEGCSGANVITNVQDNTNDCGVGTVSRTYTVIDQSGNLSQCTQIVTVIRGTPLTCDDIYFYADTIITDCTTSLNPDDLENNPFLLDVNGCSNIQKTYHDSILIGVDTFCYAVQRVWTITDLCQPVGSQFVCRDTQNIYVIDTASPELIINYPLTYFRSQDNCELFLDLSDVTVVDCSPENVVVTNDSDFALDNNSSDASGTYPIGTTTFSYYLSDLCGNTSSYTVSINVLDTFQAQLSCPDSFVLTLDTIVHAQSVRLYADTFFSHLNIDAVCNHNYVFTFTKDCFLDSKGCIWDKWECGSIHRDEFIDVFMYEITPLGDTVLVDSCTHILVRIHENPGWPCDGGGGEGLAGFVRTENSQALRGAEVTCDIDEQTRKTKTDENGRYKFDPIKYNNQAVITPRKNDDPLNGVSTYDIIKISNHILGLGRLNTPYKLIAADVNKDAKISVSDIVQIRKLILGIYDEFPDNQSWRFVSEQYVFADPLNAMKESFPESVSVKSDDLVKDINFKAVKVGDVTDNAETQVVVKAEPRGNARDLVFETADKYVSAGDEFELTFYGTNISDYSGFQSSLQFDPEMAEMIGVAKYALPDLGKENFGSRFVDNGVLTMSWSSNKNIAQGKTEMFTLKFKAKQSFNTRDLVYLSSKVTYKESYTKTGLVSDITMLFERDINVSADNYELYQNQPNPFQHTTTIYFRLPSSMQATITVLDVTGKELYKITNHFDKGLNKVVLDNLVNAAPGVLYYKLETSDFIAAKKMVLVK